ncbi:MAG: RNA methyltransferase [Muribaculaceae bacterium]|nr:RNA methyltransferase [Muribaculaceae bacterium]
MEITSVNNELVKDCVKLQQKKYRKGKFLLEGYKAIKEAFDFGIKLEHVFVNKNCLKEYDFVNDVVIETNEAVLKKLCTTESAPESVAVGIQKIYDKNVLNNAQKVVLLEDIRDLGNLGTIIRSAVAFGADAIVLYGGSVDIYNPKCVRSSVGQLWKIPIIEIKDFSQLNEIFSGYKRVATLPRSNNMLKTFRTDFPCLVMFGSEANGLSDELIEFATDSVKIEMAQTVESLNLAASAAVVLYEIFIKGE